jgi:hypothetical protein
MLSSDLNIVNGMIRPKGQRREISFQGLQIVIENEKGSIRHWERDGEQGETKMFYPYGFIKGTLGKDGEEVDCFIGNDKFAPFAYIIYPAKTKGFDIKEDKMMLGFGSKDAARDAFMAHYNNQKFLGDIVELPMHLFKESIEWRE